MSRDIELIIHLQKLTLSQQIAWKPSQPHQVITMMKEEHIPTCYVTLWKNSEFYLYVERYRNYDGEFDTWGFSERVILDIVDNDILTWENYVDQGPLRDLLRIVMNSAANLDRYF